MIFVKTTSCFSHQKTLLSILDIFSLVSTLDQLVGQSWSKSMLTNLSPPQETHKDFFINVVPSREVTSFNNFYGLYISHHYADNPKISPIYVVILLLTHICLSRRAHRISWPIVLETWKPEYHSFITLTSENGM